MGSGTVSTMPDIVSLGAAGNYNRGPAVLPQNDPSLRALSKPSAKFASFNDELALAKAKNPFEDFSEDEKKRKEAKNQQKTAAEELAQQEFENSIGELMGRKTPYVKKDYEYFRDFIAQQNDRLGQTNTSATDFRQKARKAFEMFHEGDSTAQTLTRKEAYRRFIAVKDGEEQGQQLLTPTPTPHSDPFFFSPTTH